jgi:hypothetical protein
MENTELTDQMDQQNNGMNDEDKAAMEQELDNRAEYIGQLEENVQEYE